MRGRRNPILVPSNHQQKRAWIVPNGVAYAVGLVFREYYPTLVIERVVNDQGHLLLERALVATNS